MKLVVRLLTEMLEVRILPGEPTPFFFNDLQNAFHHCEKRHENVAVYGNLAARIFWKHERKLCIFKNFYDELV